MLYLRSFLGKCDYTTVSVRIINHRSRVNDGYYIQLYQSSFFFFGPRLSHLGKTLVRNLQYEAQTRSVRVYANFQLWLLCPFFSQTGGNTGKAKSLKKNFQQYSKEIMIKGNAIKKIEILLLSLTDCNASFNGRFISYKNVVVYT